MKFQSILLMIIAQMILTACGTGATAGAQAIPSETVLKTYTHEPVTVAVTPTQTMTNTWVPSSTPTVGPPPDMELKSVTIYPEFGNFETVGQKYTLLGRVRNNTDQIMLFRDKDIVFRFNFEVWEFDERWDEAKYRHAIYEKEAAHGWDDNRIMNCILYPGDEGVIAFTSASRADEYAVSERVPNHDGPLGIWYTYEGFYNIQTDLRMDLHPAAENIEFTKENGTLIFDYDVYVPITAEHVQSASLHSWVILLDKNGMVLNFLFKRLETLGGMIDGETFHVHGATATPLTDQQRYFRPSVKITPEMIEQVDHLEVLNEEVEGLTCRTI
jgi:hypothetical protein